jgi:hypothetical protein
MTAENTQMTQTALDVLEKLSGWTDRFKYEFTEGVVTDLEKDGVMWVKNNHGSKVKTLEHMDINGSTYVREP